MLTSICRSINPNAETTMLLGRGAAIYDHIMWLAGQCYPHVNTLHIDSCEPVLNIHNLREHSPIESKILPAMITSFVEDIVNERVDQENIGYIDSERFMEFAKATGLKGIGPALKQMIDKGGVEKHTNKKNVTYRLNPEALSDATSKYFSQLPEKSSELPNLTIAFGRLPHIQSKKDDQQVEFDFFSYLSPLQPMDGLLVVLQRHDDSIPGNYIMTLEQALKGFDQKENTRLDDYHGDLIHAYNTIDTRTKEYDIDTDQHLVVINPKPNLEFQMSYFFISLLDAMSLKKTWTKNMGCRFDHAVKFNSKCSLLLFILHSFCTNVRSEAKNLGWRGKNTKTITRVIPSQSYSSEAVLENINPHGSTERGTKLPDRIT